MYTIYEYTRKEEFTVVETQNFEPAEKIPLIKITPMIDTSTA